MIKDSDGKPMDMYARTPFTQYDIDAKCRLITADQHLLTKCFGSGLAFPMRTNDGMIQRDVNKPNPRADSFSLYLNYVAKTMLTNLLPKSKMENKQYKIPRIIKNGNGLK